MTTFSDFKFSKFLLAFVIDSFFLSSLAFAVPADQSLDKQIKALQKPILVDSAPTTTSVSTAQLSPNDPSLNVITTATIKGQTLTLPLGLLNKINESGINPADVSILVQPLGIQPPADKSPTQIAKPILTHQPHVMRTPASTQKLIPTFVALDTLGANFIWQTKIFQKGLLVGNTLHGDIVIQGGGDPRLNHERLYAMLGELQKYGIKHIDGDIVIDNQAFENVNFNPSAFDGQGLKAYNAPPNALLINFGTVQVDFIPSGTWSLLTPSSTLSQDSTTALDAPIVRAQSGNEAENMETSATHTLFTPNPSANTVAIRLLPPLADYAAPNTLPASTTECGKTPFVKPSVTTNSLSFTGQYTPNCGSQSWWFTFPDSNSLVKKAVKGTWLQLDSDFKGQVRLMNEPVTRQNAPYASKLDFPLPVVSYGSLPLASQIWDINHFSNNVMTEQVTLSLPLYAGGEKISNYPKSFAFIQNWWQTHLPSTKPPIMTRGSGLCRDCQIEPASMLALLDYAYRGENFEVFKNSMGIAGVSGTMKALNKRHPDSPAIGNAWIKTGTLNDVSSMVGYVKGKSGNWYAVVGMVNTPNAGHNYLVKAILDEMLAWTALQ